MKAKQKPPKEPAVDLTKLDPELARIQLKIADNAKRWRIKVRQDKKGKGK